MTPGDARRIGYILRSAGEIEGFASRGRAAFDTDEVLRERIWHRFHIIGDCVSKFSGGFRAAHPELPIKDLKRLRNLVVHHYDEPDYDRDWMAATHAVPALAAALRAILEEWQRT